jgi:type II secretory pathway pseudopilin PulG
LTENETKFWSDLEVNSLIDEVTEAAYSAIEQAAAEAARASTLAALERETEALQEAQNWRTETEIRKKAGLKNSIITGIICFLGGIITGMVINR